MKKNTGAQGRRIRNLSSLHQILAPLSIKREDGIYDTDGIKNLCIRQIAFGQASSTKLENKTPCLQLLKGNI